MDGWLDFALQLATITIMIAIGKYYTKVPDCIKGSWLHQTVWESLQEYWPERIFSALDMRIKYFELSFVRIEFELASGQLVMSLTEIRMQLCQGRS